MNVYIQINFFFKIHQNQIVVEWILSGIIQSQKTYTAFDTYQQSIVEKGEKKRE